MRKGNRKIFLDRGLLHKMINLRINGFSIKSLSILFNCDPSSIRAQCDKYMIQPLCQVYSIERIISQAIPKQESEWGTIEGVRVNPGKNYADYLKHQYPPRKLV